MPSDRVLARTNPVEGPRRTPPNRALGVRGPRHRVSLERSVGARGGVRPRARAGRRSPPVRASQTGEPIGAVPVGDSPAARGPGRSRSHRYLRHAEASAAFRAALESHGALRGWRVWLLLGRRRRGTEVRRDRGSTREVPHRAARLHDAPLDPWLRRVRVHGDRQSAVGRGRARARRCDHERGGCVTAPRWSRRRCGLGEPRGRGRTPLDRSAR